MADDARIVVNFRTTITIKLFDEQTAFAALRRTENVSPDGVRGFGQRLSAGAEQAAQMMETLAPLGFVFSLDRSSLMAVSEVTEGQDARQVLLAQGFTEDQFHIHMEYTRKWGMM